MPKVTAIASKPGESAGVGFAIPINTISRVVPQLIRNGAVIRPGSGIRLVPDAMTHFTMRDLQTLKTPWGRTYMEFAQSFGYPFAMA